MPNVLNEKKKLLAEVLSTYQSEYQELRENWKSLETKAQAVIAIAGLFIAGAIKLFNDVKQDSPLYDQMNIFFSYSLLVKLLILSPLILLVLSILFALLGLRIRESTVAPHGRIVEPLISDIVRLPENDDFTHRVMNLYKDRFKQWRKANDFLRGKNEIKARNVLISQWMFIIGMIVAVGISLYTLCSCQANIRQGGAYHGTKLHSTGLP